MHRLKKALVMGIDIIGAFVLRDASLAFILIIVYVLFVVEREALQMGQPPVVQPARYPILFFSNASLFKNNLNNLHPTYKTFIFAPKIMKKSRLCVYPN